MIAPDIPPDITVLAGKYGIPSVILAFSWWAAPKLWAVVSARMNVSQQTNDLTQAGLGGMNDVVTTLRTQISDLGAQFKDVEQKLKDMSATLDDAVKSKIIAEAEAAKAKSDLYSMRLWIERLQAQVKSFGAVPVD